LVEISKSRKQTIWNNIGLLDINWNKIKMFLRNELLWWRQSVSTSCYKLLVSSNNRQQNIALYSSDGYTT